MKFLILLMVFSLNLYAQDKNINYTYKQYEKFDFDALDVDGGTGAPGDLTISPRFRKEFKNKLPERKNFNKEILKSLDEIR